MNSNKKYCLFPKPHLYHLLYLFYIIASIAKKIILNSTKEDRTNLSLPIFKLYVHEIGDFLSIIPYLILKKKIKSNKDTKSTNKLIAKYFYIDIFKKKKKRILINIFIIGLIEFIAQISTVVFYVIELSQKMQVNHENRTIVFIFYFVFLFLMTKFILNITFYSHHYFSLFIFLVCLICIGIIDFILIIKASKNLIDTLLYIVIMIFAYLLYSISNVLYKIMFLKYYISPYFLLLSKAVIQFFLLIVFSIPFIFVKFKNKDGEEKIIFLMVSDIFKEKIDILFYILYTIISFLYNLFNLLIIDKFSSENTAISTILEGFVHFSLGIANIKIDYYFGIILVIYILLIIGSLIFTEFLVINICGLGNGTKLFLDYKEQKDLSLINEINKENISIEYLSENNNTENSSEILTDDRVKNIELTEV